ncbi:homoserine O-succinyltransferase [Colwellia hornerae]|uniref:Homoserine O-succinyltransferase n=1 Tax=Colwellia hornerae TaxID=89402 RepID=A0A5C6Q994_9GAMM|nr:homoserine O-succinyltransferase [Colwellia hornerae]TWX50652.1 homoserine O-succinyltransferase [Colwellia hornerae]TWX56394.1 homoserine O-succinyltransferase [Colwellia hornerae]TWX65368.1 homoserine O-succinyltransferase [Colwellia hornerae]
MPIKIPDQLPALSILGEENIFVMSERRAASQEIRPMKVAILNLMPNKIETEVQILRVLSNTPLQINVDFVRIHANESKHTPKEHLDNFYRLFDDIKNTQYDGLIITGAPLALMEYEKVSFWDKICEIFDWAEENVTSTMFSCWAAHAALYHHYGLRRHLRKEKLSGVFQHSPVDQKEQLTRGFEEFFNVPHSRFGYIDKSDYLSIPELKIIAESPEAGVYVVASKNKQQVYLTGHPEYDSTTLDEEFQRDLKADINAVMPNSYYIDDDITKVPHSSWRSHASLLFTNWLNYYVYQITPYKLDATNIKAIHPDAEL